MAAITVRELLTKWGFESNTKPIEKLNKSLSDVKTTVTLIGAAAIAQVGALFGLTNAVSRAGNEFAKMSARVGIDVEALQEYSFVAKLAGSSTQEMNSAIESLTLSISEARKGSGSLIEPLIRLNQLTGKDLLTSMGNADEMFLRLADSLGQVQDRTERAELANKIFGGSGLAMINILDQGSEAIKRQRQEARDLGIVFSQQAAKQSELFQASLIRVKSAMEGIRNIVGVELMPTVMDFMDQFREWILINKDWLKTNIVKTLKQMVDGSKAMIRVVKGIVKVLDSVINSLGGFERVLKNVLFLMAAFTAIKFLSAIGNLSLAIGGTLVAAFRAVGNAALLAQAKMAILPIAIGLAVAAVFLVVDDLVAFFQGRDSLFGVMIKNFDSIKGKLGEFISDITGNIRSGIKSAITGLFEFLTSDDPADKKKLADFADGIMKAMELAFAVSSLPFKIGAAIADGIIEGMIIILRNKFPQLASFLGIKTKEELKEQQNEIDQINKRFGTKFKGDKDKENEPGFFGKTLDAFGRTFDLLTSGGDDEKGDSGQSQPSEALLEILRSKGIDPSTLFKNVNAAGASPDTRIAKPNLQLVQGGKASSQPSNVTNHNTFNMDIQIPEGTTPSQGADLVEQGVRNAMDRLARETQAATATNVRN